MRVLIITASLPYPPASGGALRVYGIVKGLHDNGHHVTMMAFHDEHHISSAHPLYQIVDEIISVPSPPDRTKSQRIWKLLSSNQPDIAKRLYSPAFVEKLTEVLKQTQFDLIQAEGIEVACYLPVAGAVQSSAKLCFDTFNAEYLLQRNIFEIDRQSIKRLPAALYSWIQAKRIEGFERAMCQLADIVIAVSDEDALALKSFREDQKIFVVPSGIFVDKYQSSDVERNPNLIVFTGKMDYRPNVDAMLWFYESIFPGVRQQIPETRLTIVGQKPHPRLDIIRNDKQVTITGWVESVQPYLNKAGVYIAPLRMGSGTRLKLLEAMASQCAIVATTMAASGLSDELRSTMFIADDANDFADKIIYLINHPEERETQGKQAHEQVKASYDWSVLTPKLLAAYGEIGLG